MRVVVLNEFRDKYQFSHIFKVGEILEFGDERANDLLSRGLVKLADEVKAEEENSGEDEAQQPHEVAEEQSTEEVGEPAEEDAAKALSEAKAADAIAKAQKAIKRSKK